MASLASGEWRARLATAAHPASCTPASPPCARIPTSTARTPPNSAMRSASPWRAAACAPRARHPAACTA
eukprot:2829321-Rhodomonas_salina.1